MVMVCSWMSQSKSLGSEVVPIKSPDPARYAGFRKRVKTLLTEREMPQSSLAKSSGIGAVVLNRILSGVRAPTLDHVGRLARALRVTQGWLLEGSDGGRQTTVAR